MSQQTTTLTLSDIKNAIILFDLMTKRGAIEGSELSIVGAVRDRYESERQRLELLAQSDVEENSGENNNG